MAATVLVLYVCIIAQADSISLDGNGEYAGCALECVLRLNLQDFWAPQHCLVDIDFGYEGEKHNLMKLLRCKSLVE